MCKIISAEQLIGTALLSQPQGVTVSEIKEIEQTIYELDRESYITLAYDHIDEALKLYSDVFIKKNGKFEFSSVKGAEDRAKIYFQKTVVSAIRDLVEEASRKVLTEKV